MDVVRPIKFAASGAISTSVHVVVAYVFLRQGLSPVWANGIAFLTATIVSCIMNTSWTFGAKYNRSQIGRFLTVTSAMAILTMGIAKVVQSLGYPPAVGIASIVLLVPPITFVLHSLWTYRLGRSGPLEPFDDAAG